MATKDKANLKSNPGIPGVVNRQEPDYLRNAANTALQELRNRNINQRAMQRIMELIDQARRMQQGYEERLQRLAETVIRSNYGSILDYVELNLKLVPFGTVADETPRYDTVLPEPPEEEQQIAMAEKAQDEQDQRLQQQPAHQNQQPAQQLLQDDDIIAEIHKRKLINNIVQGEGKNTHRLIHLPEVREELNAINPALFQIYDEILKIAEYLDWIVPTEEKLHMMQNVPEGFGGFNSVDWKQPTSFDNNQPDFDQSEDDEDMGEIQQREGKDPIINAIGVDFPMLIHESVKAIYELIASNAIPTEAFIAETVMLNTDTLADEIEDLRYGPFIAADLRDFINQCPLSTQVENLREHVFGKIIMLPADQFLQLMKNILITKQLPENQRPLQVRQYIDNLCEEIAAEIRQREHDIRFGSDDADNIIGNNEDDDTLPLPENEVEEKVQEKSIDYSKMRNDELHKLMDAALDKGDFDTVKAITPYLK